jgi:Transcriptional regulator, AbiEi antitoxin, Type IV TA system/Transcriptional regulator, AbiEi antitoxin N-terminal domain
MSNMVGQKSKRLNLERELPEGLLVDAAWLKRHHYSRQLWHHYAATGLLEQLAPRVFRRPRGSLTWQQVVISLQTELRQNLVVGGRTALELQGYAHYLSREIKEVHLYGPKRPPTWLNQLRAGARFVYHNDRKLFRKETVAPSLPGLDWNPDKGAAVHDGLTVQPWGQSNWPLTLSSPERAILELLDELPRHESFHQADVLMEGLANLSPRRLQKLLEDCRSVKVKRLFFFFADRHPHAWLKRLDKHAVGLGDGKRMLVKGGKLNKTYQITVPEEMNAVP